MSAPLTSLRDLWDFNDPAASERRFAEAEEAGRAAGDENYAWEARTQRARALGLQRRFDEAHLLLETVIGHWGQGSRLFIRYLLERGRVHNSSGDPGASVPLFTEAFHAACDAGEEFLAVDAAHMLGIVSDPPKNFEWNEEALELARTAKDPLARNWRGSLLNNLAWAYHDKGNYERALALFEEALAFRQEQGKEALIRIARWSIARCLRSLGRVEEALMRQRQLAEEAAQKEMPDGFGQEEIAECLLTLGRTAEAKPHFAKAFEQLSQDAWLAANEPQRLERLRSLAQG